jgi:hypothetical protein
MVDGGGGADDDEQDDDEQGRREEVSWRALELCARDVEGGGVARRDAGLADRTHELSEIFARRL